VLIFILAMLHIEVGRLESHSKCMRPGGLTRDLRSMESNNP
jgi:hypothetical protein